MECLTSKDSFRAWQHASELTVFGAGHAERPRKSLEQRFDLVMVRAPVNYLRMDVGFRAAGEAVEEVSYKFRLEIAHQTRSDLGIDYGCAASAEIDGDHSQSFVHRHHEISRAQDATLTAQRLGEGLAERNADVLDGVVLVHVEIAVRLQLQVERAVARNQLQHMVEKTDSAADLGATVAFDGQRNANVGFIGLAMNAGAPHAATSAPSFRSAATSRKAAISRSVCSAVPIVMRTQPSQPGSAERLRTRMPRCRIAATNSRWRWPTFSSRKLARLGQQWIPSLCSSF